VAQLYPVGCVNVDGENSAGLDLPPELDPRWEAIALTAVLACDVPYCPDEVGIGFPWTFLVAFRSSTGVGFMEESACRQ